MIDLSEPDVFISYFENIAINLKLLAHTDSDPHYWPADIQEIIHGFRSDIKSPAMVTMYKDSDLKGKTINNINEAVSGVFWIIAHISRAADEKKAALILTKKIGYQVLAKMMKDRNDNKLTGFDIDRVNIQQIILENRDWCGYRYAFNIPIKITSKVCYDSDNYTF